MECIKVKSNVNYRLWVIYVNVVPFLTIVERPGVPRREYMRTLYLPPNFAINLKLLHKVIFSKNVNQIWKKINGCFKTFTSEYF